nr:adenylate/guanylate cyclase domain-containing protein [Panacagrimonas sp.]
MGAGWLRVLRAVFGVDRMQVALRDEFAAHAYRVSAERGLRVCWAVLLFDLPLFALIDWSTWNSGQWSLQPAHGRVFWWRVALVSSIGLLLVAREFIGDERRRDRVFAWCCAVGFPLFGAWFTVICQTLITDASIYALFLIGASVVFPLPGLRKLLIYPVSLLLVLIGVQWVGVGPVPELHVTVNATCVAVGALTVEAIAMRTYVADFTKSLEIERERGRADELLRNVLPAAVAERLKTNPATQVEHHPAVSVLFADFVGFGRLAQELAPGEMIGLLDHLFNEFDEAADRFGVEKIKTLGDTYMAACGVPAAQPDHAERMANLALRMLSIADRFESDRRLPVHFRVGMHTGPAIAGIIGSRKFCYDLWGDTINVAALLQGSGAPDRIHVSQAMRDALGDGFRFQAREPIELKGRAPAATYYLLGRADEDQMLKDRARLLQAAPS